MLRTCMEGRGHCPYAVYGGQRSLSICSVWRAEVTVHMQCCLNHDIRLVGGYSQYEGRVEVCYNNTWGTVCDDRFDSNEAIVICKQLGHTGSTAYSRAYYGQGSGPIWLDDLGCSGRETRLSNCSNYVIGSNNCQHSEDASVACEVLCSPSTGFQCSNGRWCQRHQQVLATLHRFDATMGNVFSKQNICNYVNNCGDNSDELGCGVWVWGLGYGYGVWSGYGYGVWGLALGYGFESGVWVWGMGLALGSGMGMVWNMVWYGYGVWIWVGYGYGSGVGMDGVWVWFWGLALGWVWTSGLALWSGVWALVWVWGLGSAWGLGPGSGSGLVWPLGLVWVGVWLWGLGSGSGSGSTGLVWGRGLGLGSVGGSRSGVWVSVWVWGIGLGLGYGVWFRCYYWSCISATLVCDGVINCPTYWYYNDYSDESGCAINCTDFGLRLVGGQSKLEGRVEMCYNNEWGTVCDDRWDTTDAIVACRQLGFTGGTALRNAYFGQGTGPILLDELACTGTERMLINCTSDGLGVHNCVHGEDAGCPMCGCVTP
eukprot:Em0010g472a